MGETGIVKEIVDVDPEAEKYIVHAKPAHIQ